MTVHEKTVVGRGSYTTMHEYGHYLQSRRFGQIYMSKIGMNSGPGDTDWTEHDANYNAARYFQSIDRNFTWDQDYIQNNNLGNPRYSNFRVRDFERNQPVRAGAREYLFRFINPGVPGILFGSLQAPR